MILPNYRFKYYLFFGPEKEAEYRYLWYALIMETGWPFLREKKVFQYFVVKFIFDV